MKQRRADRLFLCFILLIAFALRITGLAKDGLWLDEFTSIEVARRSWEEILFGVGFDRHTPPLYYLILHEWFRFVPQNEFGLRLLSVLFDLGNCVLLWCVLRHRLERRAAQLGVLLYVLSPFAIYYAQEGRMYSMLLFWTLLLQVVLDHRHSSQRLAQSFFLIVITAAGLYTHYYFAIFLVGIGLFSITEKGFRNGLRALWPLFTGCLFFLPWISIVLELAASGGQRFRQHQSFALPYAFWRFFGGYGVLPISLELKSAPVRTLMNQLPVVLLCFVPAIVFVAGLRQVLRERAQRSRYLLLMLLTTPIMAIFLSLKAPMLSERYLIVIYPFVIAVLAVGLSAQVGMTGRVICFGIWLFALSQHYLNPLSGKAQWRDVALQIHASEPRPVIVNPGFCSELVRYYLGREWTIISGEQFEISPTASTSKIWVIESRDTRSIVPNLETANYQVRQDTVFPKENGLRLVLAERE